MQLGRRLTTGIHSPRREEKEEARALKANPPAAVDKPGLPLRALTERHCHASTIGEWRSWARPQSHERHRDGFARQSGRQSAPAVLARLQAVRHVQAARAEGRELPVRDMRHIGAQCMLWHCGRHAAGRVELRYLRAGRRGARNRRCESRSLSELDLVFRASESLLTPAGLLCADLLCALPSH